MRRGIISLNYWSLEPDDMGRRINDPKKNPDLRKIKKRCAAA